MRTPGFNASRYQAVLSYANRQDLWEQWKAIYTNLSNPNRQADATTFYEQNKTAMLEGAKVLWPEVEPYEYLMRVRVDEGVASFQSEKQNDPFDPDLMLFDMRQARRCAVQFENGQLHAIRWLDGSGKTVQRDDIEKIVAFHDPAFSKKPGQNTEPDYAAIVVVAKDQDGYLYCLDAYLSKDPVSKQIQRAYELCEKWDIEILYLEENGGQVLLKDLYREAGNEYPECGMRIKGVTQTENKFKRISTLEPEITNGYLFFADTLNPLMMDQMTQFPTGADDGPDALQGAVAQLKKRYDTIRNSPADEPIWPWQA